MIARVRALAGGSAARAVGALLVGAGFVAIALAWQGAGDTEIVTTQIAFGVSGGLGGLALVAVGAAVLAADASRLRSAQELLAHAEVLHEVTLLAEALASPAPKPTRRGKR